MLSLVYQRFRFLWQTSFLFSCRVMSLLQIVSSYTFVRIYVFIISSLVCYTKFLSPGPPESKTTRLWNLLLSDALSTSQSAVLQNQESQKYHKINFILLLSYFPTPSEEGVGKLAHKLYFNKCEQYNVSLHCRIGTWTRNVQVLRILNNNSKF